MAAGPGNLRAWRLPPGKTAGPMDLGDPHRTALIAAVLLAALAVPSAIGWLFDSRLMQGTSVWSKPLKFQLWFALHWLTIAWTLSHAAADFEGGRGRRGAPAWRCRTHPAPARRSRRSMPRSRVARSAGSPDRPRYGRSRRSSRRIARARAVARPAHDPRLCAVRQERGPARASGETPGLPVRPRRPRQGRPVRSLPCAAALPAAIAHPCPTGCGGRGWHRGR